MQINRMEFHASIVNLCGSVEKVIDVVAENAAKKGITLINTVAKNTHVSSDNNMLFSILQNLISNAIKFTFQNGKVEIRDEDLDDFVKVSMLDIPHEYRVREGMHSWVYWRSGLLNGLKFIGETFH